MKFKILSVTNLIVTLLLIYWNYLSNTGFIDGKTIGSVSGKYDSLFTPAGYAFSIWGIIFLGLIVFGVFAVYLAFTKPDKYHHVEKAIPLMIGVNLLNGAWVYYWLTEDILMSVIIMFLMFSWFLRIIIQLKMELWDAPCKVIALIWWPIDLYFGWIMVAFVANVSSYLNYTGFSMGLQERTWVIIMIGVVTLINFLLVQKRNLREVGLVAVWALVAIAVRHWNSEIAIAYPAAGAAAFLLVTIQLHAIKNKATMPFVKKKWSEVI